MTTVLGLMLGAGLVLLAAPFLWPASRTRRRTRLAGVDGMRAQLARAGLQAVSVGGLFTVSILAAIVGTALAFALVPVVAIAVIVGLATFALPTIIVFWRARARRRATRVVWPDVVDHLVSAVRSGLALPDSVASLAHAGPLPTRAGFAAFEASYRATGNFGLCLDQLKGQLADPVADRILETLRMSREVGGSELTTVLRNLASFLRQESALRMEVEARQSWTVNAARLGVAAPWIVLLLLSVRPEAAAAYNSPTGVSVIVAGFIVSVIAYRVMMALGRMPEERRWFS